MTGRVWLLLAWIVVGAAVLFAHVVVLAQVWLHARKLSWRWKLAALVPLVAPVAAWIDGRRAAPLAWVVLVATYIALRLVD